MAKYKRQNGYVEMTLRFPEQGFDEIAAIAEAKGCTPLDVIKRGLKLALTLAAVENSDTQALIWRDGDTDQRIGW